MANKLSYDVIVVGAGPAGMTAAMYAGRAMLKTALIERGQPGGELLNTEVIEDYPGFSRIDGWELAQKFESHTKEFGAEFRTANVTSIRKLADGNFQTLADNGDEYISPTVILTAGGTPVKLGIPGEAEYAGKGVSYCAICDGAFFKGHVLAVVGGGDAACEEADFLTRYASKVYLIHRRDEFRASKIIQKRVFENPKIEVIWNTVVDEIHADEKGLVDHLTLHNVQTRERRRLDVTGIFIFIGFTPNTGLIKDHVVHDAMGYLKTNDHMQTSIPGLFAAGDVRAQLTRQVTTAVGDATTAAVAAEKYLTALRDVASTPMAATA